jgi:hypothetical protein
MVAPNGRVMLFKRLVRPRWLRWTMTLAPHLDLRAAEAVAAVVALDDRPEAASMALSAIVQKRSC